MSSLKLSPISMHLLKAESNALSEDFQSNSAIEILQIGGDRTLESISKKSFPTSFVCCDWAFSDHIAAGGD